MLPYPDMDFVPLDVLAAAELNQIVANILALANGAGIADDAIASRHIDFATFETNASYAGGATSLGQSTIKIPQGIGGVLVGYTSGRNTATGDNILTANFVGTGVTQLISGLSTATVQYSTKTAIAIAILSPDHAETIYLNAGQSSTSDQNRQGWFLIPNTIKIIN